MKPKIPQAPCFITREYDFRRLPVVGASSWRDRKYELLSPLVFLATHNQLIVAPVERITNFGTVPPVLHWLYPPDGPWFDAAIGHDEICNESHNPPPGWEHAVWDMRHRLTQELLYEFTKISRNTFDAIQINATDAAVRVDSRRAADIMREMMATEPNRVPRRKQFFIYWAVRAFGPHWQTKDKPL